MELSITSSAITNNGADLAQDEQKPSRKGANNPFYGKRHTDEEKRKISDTQKQRYQMMRRMVQEQNDRNSAERALRNEAIRRQLRSIIREEIKKLL